MELVAQARAFQHALLELLPLIHAEDRALASAHAVSATQCLALRLCSEDTPLTVNDLAMLLHLDKSTASRVAAGLVEKGYLSRSRDQADGRVAWLEATPAGHRLRMSLEDAWAARYAEVLSNFDPEVRSAMTRLLSRLTASMAARAERAVDG
jgi:DNA-binding MarR family transcriptional regulator